MQAKPFRSNREGNFAGLYSEKKVQIDNRDAAIRRVHNAENLPERHLSVQKWFQRCHHEDIGVEKKAQPRTLQGR